MNKIYISGTHAFARELLSRPDDLLTVTCGDKEYVIRGFKKTKTHANEDDSVLHTTIICDEETGSVIR